MSGQQEPWSGLDRFDQLDPHDSTLELSGLISRLNSGTQNNGSLGNRSNGRGNGGQDNGTGVGNSALAGNSVVNGTGDTVPYVRPPQRAPAEHDVAQPPPPPVPPVTAVRGAHAAVTVRPEPPGPNGHGALAAYDPYAAPGTHVAPRHSRGSAETMLSAVPPAQHESTVPPETTALRETATERDVAVEPEAAAWLDVEAEPDAGESRPAPDLKFDPRPLPEPSALPSPATSAARPERLAPGSLADLRQRLERLPYGHPSSPYHVDGERKPPPHRLKHLELAPSTPSRIAQAPSQPAIVEHDPVAAAPDAPIAATASSAPAAATAPSTQSESTPRLGSAMLTQDQLQIANDAYDRFRAAEGRNLFGSYGSTGLTAVLREVAVGLEYGELAPNTEQNALLEPEAFRARFAAMLARYPDRSAELLARRIPGAISYSFVFDAERYSAGIWMTQDALTTIGFQLLARRNDWNNAANRCVATMWHDPTSGLPFEVQFHTTASLEAQQLARSSATLIGDPRLPPVQALPPPPGLGQIGEYRRQGDPPQEGAARG